PGLAPDAVALRPEPLRPVVGPGSRRQPQRHQRRQAGPIPMKDPSSDGFSSSHYLASRWTDLGSIDHAPPAGRGRAGPCHYPCSLREMEPEGGAGGNRRRSRPGALISGGRAPLPVSLFQTPARRRPIAQGMRGLGFPADEVPKHTPIMSSLSVVDLVIVAVYT